jgi:hypothetical protein
VGDAVVLQAHGTNRPNITKEAGPNTLLLLLSFRPDQPFTAPAAMPSTMFFCMMK